MHGISYAEEEIESLSNADRKMIFQIRVRHENVMMHDRYPHGYSRRSNLHDHYNITIYRGLKK